MGPATAWTVRVRWLAWRPRRRRDLRDWRTDAFVPVLFAVRTLTLTSLVLAAGLLLIGGLIFVIGLALAIVAWAGALGGLLVSTVSHFVLGRPFLVEARSATGHWEGWWVVGWRHARSVREQVQRALDGGAPVGQVDVPGAQRA